MMYDVILTFVLETLIIQVPTIKLKFNYFSADSTTRTALSRGRTPSRQRVSTPLSLLWVVCVRARLPRR